MTRDFDQELDKRIKAAEDELVRQSEVARAKAIKQQEAKAKACKAAIEARQIVKDFVDNLRGREPTVMLNGSIRAGKGLTIGLRGTPAFKVQIKFSAAEPLNHVGVVVQPRRTFSSCTKLSSYLYDELLVALAPYFAQSRLLVRASNREQFATKTWAEVLKATKDRR